MFGSNYLLGQVSQSILAELRRQIFHRMLHWPAETYQTNSTGLVTSKFVFEGNFALSNAAKSAITLVRDSIQVAALTVVLFWHNWELAMIALVIGPFVAWLLRYISAKMKKVMSSSQANIADSHDQGFILGDAPHAASLHDGYCRSAHDRDVPDAGGSSHHW